MEVCFWFFDYYLVRFFCILLSRREGLVRKIGENAHKSRAFYGLGQFTLVKRANARSSFGHDP